MTFRTRLLTGFLLLVSSTLSAGNWQVIQHPHFNLIFDQSIEAEARRTASRLAVYLDLHLTELPIERGLPPTDIVLMTDAHIANGFVGIFPYRSIWYNRPAPFAQLEWLDVLAVHEGRHIVQFNQSRDSAWVRMVSFLFGEAGQGAFLLLLPDWYLEGDATVSETTLTEGGRGRVASFDLWYRTDLLTQEPYDYERAMLGTGFDRIPYIGPYVLGYYFTGYLRRTYGDDLFDEALDDIGQWTGWTFNAAIRERTGKNLDALYDDMLNELTTQWRHQLTTELTTDAPMSEWNSRYPVWAEGDQSAMLTLGLTERPRLVFETAGQITRSIEVPTQVARHYRSGSKTRAISVLNERACWVLERAHLNHPFISYGDIECVEPDDRRHRLTNNDKLTSLIQTPDGFKAHRFDAQRRSSLVHFSADGTELTQWALPTHTLAYDLFAQGDKLYFVLSGSDRDGIYRLDTRSNQPPAPVVLAQQESLRAPTVTDHWLVFTSDRSGRDQLMAQHRNTQTQYQLTESPFGAYYPVWNASEQQLNFADYQSDGMQQRSQTFTGDELPASHWVSVSPMPTRKVWVDALIPATPALAEPSQSDWEVSQYSIAKNLWNPYSWAILGDTSSISGTLHSLDTLSKLALSASAGYHFEANDWFGSLAAQYRLDSGPRINAGWAKTIDETTLNTGMSLPMAVQNRLGQSQFLLQAGVEQRFQPDNDDTFLSTTLSAAYQHQRAMQAIETPLGIAETINTRFNLNDNELSALSDTRLALAGWHSRHALNARLGSQWLNDETPLLLDSPLFTTPDAQGLTLQGDVDYRINLGPVGAGLGSLLYWRNTEISLNGRAQLTDSTTETAVGLSFSPNLTFFRNPVLTTSPQLSVYYLPGEEAFQVTASVRIANF
ncbi:TolB family protein [Reinekea blandensis]|uniref:Uncharacterized protein n=1 Tax=Reinekea blandensis MED297 TaxID=314283 RepID=A4BA89_9GAMM|nr:hypothetical protein [Reinekea blandensis]EAR10845.1 hypothetical protein MED297_10056 [Reinekea sp. MED297] [Reinekea blandensis MED297]